MCGIFAIVNLKKEYISQQTINNVMNSMNHRGPDSEGTRIINDSGVFLAHKRLSIIDQSTNGHQPMSLEEITLIFNGEIYNYKDLIVNENINNADLKSFTDTEVVLHLYRKHGIDFVKLLKGMWAFVIIDKSNGVIYASRDRLGMKPLYFYEYENGIILASEIKSIISSGLYKVEMDFDALDEYFGFQNLISNKTLFKNIKMLMPGYNLEYFFQEYKVRTNQYWDLDLSKKIDISFDDAVNKIDLLLDQSIQRHLIGDRDIGITLSGGIDSSTILNYASKYKTNINTFTGYFNYDKLFINDYCNNENKVALKLSKKFNTKHHELGINSNDVLSNIENIAWHLEDPRVGASYTFYLISKLVSNHVTVNLSGTGGDELFGGYTWRLDLVEKILEENFDDEFYKISQRLLKEKDKKYAFENFVLDQIDLNASRKSFQQILDKTENYNKLDKALYFEFKTLLHGFLIVEDKLGMASSIETRFPLLDYDLIDFVSKLPIAFKHSLGKSKLLLKKNAEGFLSQSMIDKKKQGFTPPELTWYGTILNLELNNYLISKDSHLPKLFKRGFIIEVLNDVTTGIDQRALIWSFMFIESWIRVFKPTNV